jgi:1,4-alpha-glucan branching enzyme
MNIMALKKSSLSMYDLPMGASLNDDGSCTFKVWAPNAQSVGVVGSFNEWNKKKPIKLSKDQGYWFGKIDNVNNGDEYLYQIKYEKNTFTRIDPYARSVTNSSGNGIVYKNDFDWQEEHYKLPYHNSLMIYELHVGSYTMREDGTPGTFDDLIEKLDYLIDLGVNVIQLMPICEFAGDMSWGYNPANIFAIESAYGGPDAFKRFVKEAHNRGIGVLVDVVFNHFGPSDLALWQFDGWSENGKGGIYFYNDYRSATPWGDTRPDYGRKEVQDYILDNVRMWVEDFHVDGLRLDMTIFMRTISGNTFDDGDVISEGWDMCRKINDLAHTINPNILMISEDLQGDAAITLGSQDGGAGFNAQWDRNFVHPVRAILLEVNDNDRNLDEVQNAIMNEYNGNPFSRVIYTESHDEVANGKQRVPSEIDGEGLNYFAVKRAVLGTCLTLTSAGIPMFFQGQEFLQCGWFQDSKSLSWHHLESYEGIVHLHKDLIAKRLNINGEGTALIGSNTQVLVLDHNARIVAISRHADGQESFIVVFNFGSQVVNDYPILMHNIRENPQLVFNSDARIYHDEFSDIGHGYVHEGKIITTIAAYSCLIFK